MTRCHPNQCLPGPTTQQVWIAAALAHGDDEAKPMTLSPVEVWVVGWCVHGWSTYLDVRKLVYKWLVSGLFHLLINGIYWV